MSLSTSGTVSLRSSTLGLCRHCQTSLVFLRRWRTSPRSEWGSLSCLRIAFTLSVIAQSAARCFRSCSSGSKLRQSCTWWLRWRLTSCKRRRQLHQQVPFLPFSIHMAVRQTDIKLVSEHCKWIEWTNCIPPSTTSPDSWTNSSVQPETGWSRGLQILSAWKKQKNNPSYCFWRPGMEQRHSVRSDRCFTILVLKLRKPTFTIDDVA